MTAIDLLRKLQWRGDSYSCIGCGAHHRDGCKPDCEVDALLNAPVIITPMVASKINGKPVSEIIAAVNSAPSSGTGIMLPGTVHAMRYMPVVTPASVGRVQKRKR